MLKFFLGKGSSPALVTQESVEPIAALAPPLTEETASEGNRSAALIFIITFISVIITT